METNPMKCKIVLLGDQSVGKTSIINRFIFDNFTGNEQPTVGVDFVSKTVNVENKSLRMQLWDTAGQERFHSLIPSYIRDCNSAVIIYDITSANSYNNLGKWIDSVREVRGEEALILVVGNKKDLKDERVVQYATAKEEFGKLGITFTEVSAKSGANVKQFFTDLAYMTAMGKKSKEETKKPQPPPVSDNINLTDKAHRDAETRTKKKGCC